MDKQKLLQECRIFPQHKLIEKSGSIGKPIKDGNFSLEPNGELVYFGPNVGCGYCYGMEDLKECAYQKELHTGDIARVDADGYYFITGRMKRFIKLFGNRISLDELENDLKEHYSHFVGCTGIEDKKLLVFSDSTYINANEIKNYISAKYQLHISVIGYIYAKDIPLTSSQKVNYQAIIQLAMVN
jgi:long-chain acyl-CoA synthetase